ncbi:MAG: GNAT family N-acetyltransferase [Acidobacteria bacterium]|nr:GNAT family N-acetyltransferase [Acidobacteriota bacterium]
MEFRVRRAGPGDAPALAAFQVAMALETEGKVLDPERVGKGVRHILGCPERGYYLVAEADGRPAGCLMVLYEWSDWRGGEVLWVHSVYVVPDCRGAGAFREMFGRVKREAAERTDVHGIRLYVERGNRNAAAVYRHCGMDDGHYRLFEWMKE